MLSARRTTLRGNQTTDLPPQVIDIWRSVGRSHSTSNKFSYRGGRYHQPAADRPVARGRRFRADQRGATEASSSTSPAAMSFQGRSSRTRSRRGAHGPGRWRRRPGAHRNGRLAGVCLNDVGIGRVPRATPRQPRPRQTARVDDALPGSPAGRSARHEGQSGVHTNGPGRPLPRCGPEGRGFESPRSPPVEACSPKLTRSSTARRATVGNYLPRTGLAARPRGCDLCCRLGWLAARSLVPTLVTADGTRVPCAASCASSMPRACAGPRDVGRVQLGGGAPRAPFDPPRSGDTTAPVTGLAQHPGHRIPLCDSRWGRA
jgi:hypothetical protein